MLWFLYNVLFPVAFLLMLPTFLLRMLKRGGYKKHFEQRFGLYGEGVTGQLKTGRYVWIHAVSVGEVNVALSFIAEYRKQNPEALFVLSTNTSTAHVIGEKRIDPRDVLIYFPMDMPFIIKRALDVINPVKLILVECELWPNLIRQANRRGIPVALINGRISDSSFKGYMKLRAFTRRLLPMIDPVCVQGRRDADRLIALGARPETVHVLGTAKYDVPSPAPDADAPARAVLKRAGVPDEALILLGGSTWPGEEEVLCKIYKSLLNQFPQLFLVLVPRHAERREDVLADVEKQEISYRVRSHCGPGALAGRSEREKKHPGEERATPNALIVDTTGELMSFYAAADLVFVGKSLTQHGGQNPIEPALFGKPIVVGPHMENFPVVMDDFISAHAVRQLADFPPAPDGLRGARQALEGTISELLTDSTVRKKLGEAARSVVESHRGAIGNMAKRVGSKAPINTGRE